MDDSDPAIVQAADIVLSILVPTVVAVVTVFAHRLVKYLERRFEFDIPDKIEARIDRVVVSAVAYGEQKARKALKENGRRLEMGEKKEAALEFAMTMAIKYDLPEWTNSHLEDMIEAKLGRINMLADEG